MLRTRWLGRVPLLERDDLVHSLRDNAADDYLLLCEPLNVEPSALRRDGQPARPGQLVGYLIVATTSRHNRSSLEWVEILIEALARFGLRALPDLTRQNLRVDDAGIA